MSLFYVDMGMEPFDLYLFYHKYLFLCDFLLFLVFWEMGAVDNKGGAKVGQMRLAIKKHLTP
jgi:hypothetical protein